tara:strand:- start:506 stop:3124 length:2619 start_codon:yes stop_codon:yes gene_type:complete
MKYFHLELLDNWKISSSSDILESGKELSLNPVLSKSWLSCSVPTTVLGALVKNKVYEQPYFGENLKEIPTDQFQVPWWYCKQFHLTEEQSCLFGELIFEGINYKANVWLNGHLVANCNQIDGAYKITSFPVTSYLEDGENMLAIEVIPPQPGDFSTGFVDWNPAPPDGNMGIFRPVKLKLHGGALIERPFVKTHLENYEGTVAELTITTEVHNRTKNKVSGVMVGSIGNLKFSKSVTLEPHSHQLVEIDSQEVPELRMENPRLWWPIGLGEPNLYQLQIEFLVNDELSSQTETRFGIRSTADYWVDDIHRGFKINGRKLLIKGAGWTDDLLLMDTHEKLETQIQYVKQMNLNCIRLEGFWGTDQKIYDLCDEHGILIMAGWSCHWEHEIHMGVPVSERFGSVYKKDDIDHVAKAWEDQIIWLRNHPSIFVWTVASDKVPITELEEKYIESFTKYDTTRPYLNSTGGVGSDQHVIGSEDVVSEISGSSGVKMLGPYAYTAPVYWYTDINYGGAYGFNTETGPGAQVPVLQSIQKFIPEEKLWPISEVWNYHCGRYEFADLSRFNEAIEQRYGLPENIYDFDKKAQALNYELMRPMFEAFRVNKSKTTGIIQWMLNAAWPKMYWQVYDYYLVPTGAFYAVQKACSSLQIIYNYGNHHIYVVNDELKSSEELMAQVRVYDINSNLLFSARRTLNAQADSSEYIMRLEEIQGLTTTYFLDLRLFDTHGNQLNTNFYWLSTQEELLDYKANLGEFAFHTPSKQYADLTLLKQLPKVNLDARYTIEESNGELVAEVLIENRNDEIAFLICAQLVDENEELIVPVFWNDNYISLLPHEKRVLKTRFKHDGEAKVKVSGWNTNIEQSVKIADTNQVEQNI